MNAIKLPSINPNVAAENARNENPFSISSIAISNPPRPKPTAIPYDPFSISVGCTWLMA
jgi:hypothetical protein